MWKEWTKKYCEIVSLGWKLKFIFGENIVCTFADCWAPLLTHLIAHRHHLTMFWPVWKFADISRTKIDNPQQPQCRVWKKNRLNACFSHRTTFETQFRTFISVVDFSRFLATISITDPTCERSRRTDFQSKKNKSMNHPTEDQEESFLHSHWRTRITWSKKL